MNASVAKPIRIAFSGLGEHAEQSHLAHLVKNGDCQVVGYFDTHKDFSGNTEWLAKYGLTESFKKYETYEALLADPNVDAILISSPDRFHLPQLREAAKAGKQVFCEKPLCSTEEELAQLKGILDAAEQNGQKITTCHPRRFDPPYMWLKENLAALTEKYGRVLDVSLDFSYHEPSADKAGLHGGSLLLDHANHEIDYINYLLDTNATNMMKQADGNDYYALSGVRDDGVTINFKGTRRLPSSIYPEFIRIRFDRADLEINTYDARLSRILDHDAIVHQVGDKITPEATAEIRPDHPVTSYIDRFVRINQDWLDSMSQDKAGYVSKGEMLFNTAASVRLKDAEIGEVVRIEEDQQQGFAARVKRTTAAAQVV